MEIGLGTRHIAFDGDPAQPTERGTAAPTFAINGRHIIRGPCLLWPDGWMDQDATWYGGRPLPRLHYVSWATLR